MDSCPSATPDAKKLGYWLCVPCGQQKKSRVAFCTFLCTNIERMKRRNRRAFNACFAPFSTLKKMEQRLKKNVSPPCNLAVLGRGRVLVWAPDVWCRRDRTFSCFLFIRGRSKNIRNRTDSLPSLFYLMASFVTIIFSFISFFFVRVKICTPKKHTKTKRQTKTLSFFFPIDGPGTRVDRAVWRSATTSAWVGWRRRPPTRVHP